MDDYERKKQVLKSLLSPDLFRCAEDYIENGSPWSPMQRSEMFSSNPFPTSLASVPKSNSTVMQQLLEMHMGNTRGLLDSLPSSSVTEDASALLLQQLNARMLQNNSSIDLLTLLDLLSNVPLAADRISSGGSTEAELSRPTAGTSNGFSRFISENASPPSANRYNLVNSAGAGPANASARPYSETVANPSGVVRSYSDNVAGQANLSYGDIGTGSAIGVPYADGLAGPPRYPPAQAVPPRQYHPGFSEGATVPPNAPSAAAPPVYMPGNYSSTQPPASRPFYGHFSTNNMPNPPYPGVVMTQAPRPPLPSQNNPYLMGGRYPSNQQYYPPYQ